MSTVAGADAALRRHSEKLARIAGAGIVAIAVLALAGWFLDVEVLRGGSRNSAAMNPATAVLFSLLGVCLCLRPARAEHSRRDVIVGAVIAVLGAAKLAASAAGVEIGFDAWLLADKLNQVSAGPPNRMAPNTAAAFIVSGVALATAASASRTGRAVSQIAGALAILAGMMTLVGYAFASASFYQITGFIPMAPNTALLFTLFGLGALAIHSHEAPLSVLWDEGSAGVIMRRLVPAAVALPIAMGWLRLKGQQAGLYSTEAGVAMIAVFHIAILLALLVSSMLVLQRSEARRRDVEDHLRASEEALRQLAESIDEVFFLLDVGLEKIVYISPAYDRVWGRSRAALYSEPRAWMDAIHPEDRPGVAAAYAKLVQAGDFQLEYRIIRADGSSRWVSARGYGIRDKVGQLRRIAGLARDITEQRATEDSARHARQQLSAEVDRQAAAVGRLGRYLPPQVVGAVLRNEAATTARRRKVTILFIDLRGFTELCESLEPEDALAVLTEYRASVADCVETEGGTLDKYIGDGVMAVFGDPIEQPDHPLRALRAALDMLKRVALIHRRWFPHGDRSLAVGIGINTGYATVGNIGAPNRMEYTAFGSEVNVAARLQAFAEPGEILVSASTYSSVQEEYPGVQRRVKPKGLPEMTVYAVRAPA